jgi:hypothetical protein
MRFLLPCLLAVHGAIHLLGAARGLGWARVAALTQPVSRTAGAACLAAAACLSVAAVVRLAWPRWWWVAALPGVILSQGLIVATWRDAKAGTVANALLLVPLVVAMANERPSALRKRFARDAAAALASVAGADPAPITGAEVDALPAPLARYLRRAGVVGRPHPRALRLVFDAEMRAAPDAPWMRARAEQVETFDPPARLFFMEATRAGVPFVVFHRYVGDAATFEVQVAGVVPVVDQRGPAMTRAETVTLFNDLVLLAPAALLRAHVAWMAVDDTTVTGRFTNAGHTVSATITVAPDGRVLNFASDDRAKEAHGRLVPLPWDTPVARWARFDGLELAAEAEARYREDGRWWAYGRFRLVEVAFDDRAR